MNLDTELRKYLFNLVNVLHKLYQMIFDNYIKSGYKYNCLAIYYNFNAKIYNL